MLRKKTKVGSINIDTLLKVGQLYTYAFDQPILQEFKASADLQITRDMYEDALRDLQEDQVFINHPICCAHSLHQVILRNRNNVRILTPAAGGD